MNRSLVQKRFIVYLTPILLLMGGWFLLHLLCRGKPIAAKPLIIAHRGAAGLAPENTLAAIRKGLAHHAHGIEVDVQRSADGVLVLIHDETVNRTTNGAGAVRELSWSEMRHLDGGSYYSSLFAGEPIPMLEDALALLRKEAVTLVIEIKDPHFYPEMSRQIVEMISRYDAQNQVVVISFDHTELQIVQRLAPDIRLGILLTRPWPVPKIAKSQIVDVYWLTVLLDPTFVRRMHGQGYEVWVWTVNSPALMNWLRWLGVDGLTTDHPELAAWPA
jgi:glycerophosphoryl diester phosphodiesterase